MNLLRNVCEIVSRFDYIYVFLQDIKDNPSGNSSQVSSSDDTSIQNDFSRINLKKEEKNSRDLDGESQASMTSTIISRINYLPDSGSPTDVKSPLQKEVISANISARKFEKTSEAKPDYAKNWPG